VRVRACLYACVSSQKETLLFKLPSYILNDNGREECRRIAVETWQDKGFDLTMLRTGENGRTHPPWSTTILASAFLFWQTDGEACLQSSSTTQVVIEDDRRQVSSPSHCPMPITDERICHSHVCDSSRTSKLVMQDPLTVIMSAFFQARSSDV